MKYIELPCYGIVVTVTPEGPISGSIRSDLHKDSDPADKELNGAFDAIESMILAHAIAGVNIEAPAYLEGIEVAVNEADQHFG